MFAEEKSPILLSDLYWENYDLVYANAYGTELKFFNLFKNNTFDIDSFQKVITSGPTEKKIVILNFPNNPTGYTPSKTDAEKIIKALTEAAAAGNRLVVVMDDSYFGLAFEDDIYKESLFAQLSQAHTNLLAIKVDGITKEEYAWGFRVGFITYGIKNGSKELYKALEDKTAGAIRGNISNASHPSQSLFLAALKSATYEQEKKRNIEKMHERYSKVKEVLKAHPRSRSVRCARSAVRGSGRR
jgi:aspartate/methionine/tyrosine aminotransferase